jgi:peptidoglycan/LPS O-acetylase OafA/YrhL
MDMNYKKYFLKTLITALVISAIIGIYLFLFGDFEDSDTRLLLTTLTVGWYSMTGLCSSVVHSRKKIKVFSLLGMTISIIGFFITVIAIWVIVDNDLIWRLVMTFVILSVMISHVSLLFLVKPNSKKINYLMITTIIFITLVTAMLIIEILTESEKGEFFYRLLGVFAILDVLGTISTPVLNRMTKRSE